MTNLNSVLKSRDITLPTKIRLAKAMVFQVVMYRSESWTIKNVEGLTTDAFELWCWRRLLRVSWTARRSSQSILKEISPEQSSEGLMLKLKLQSFGQPEGESWLIGKDPDAGKDWKQEEKGETEDEVVGWYHWLNDMNLSKLSEILEDRCAAVHGVTKSQTWLSNWTTTITDEHRCKNP